MRGDKDRRERYVVARVVRRRRKALDLSQADLVRLGPCFAAMSKKIETDQRRPLPQPAACLGKPNEGIDFYEDAFRVSDSMGNRPSADQMRAAVTSLTTG